MIKINTKIIGFLMIAIMVATTIAPIISQNNISAKKTLSNHTTEKITIFKEFSKPELKQSEKITEIDLKEATSYTQSQGIAKIPVVSETIKLPMLTSIKDISFTHTQIEKMQLENDISKVPYFKTTNMETIYLQETEEILNIEKFPNTWYRIQKGSGLDTNNQHITYLTIFYYPIHYIQNEESIEYITSSEITIEYETKPNDIINTNNEDEYDLLIITPETFSDELDPLVNHKIETGIKTKIKTVEEIYEENIGKDEQEQIKYYIYEQLENYNIKYVLLVGDIRKIPIRTTDAYPWSPYHGYGILSDLYYSDIYNDEYNFCTWDSNDNNIYGEFDFYGHLNDPDLENIDEVDLYADVHIGRLACRSEKEVNTVVEKIINYEKYTYDSLWFKKIILAGGDTFPPSKNSEPFVYEGEITNQKVAQELDDFQQIKLWASKRNLGAKKFNNAINSGAGFLTYAGHGFEHGWGTYSPNSMKKKIGLTDPFYYTPFLQFLNNGDKLPVVFFDACLTAKLDFNMSDLKSYYKIVRTLLSIYGFDYDVNNYFPSFAWCFVMKENGGAIATIGATRPAYSWVDKSGVHAGAGLLDWMFFKSYNEGVTVGEMLTQAQASYINRLGMDCFTIEEYILLGDPSLRVGGV